MEEFPDEYMENGVRNWLKIQQDVAFIKKNFKLATLPSLEMIKSIVEKKYQCVNIKAFYHCLMKTNYLEKENVPE